LRTYVNTSEQRTGPEQSTNWSLGFDLAPPRFLEGLDIQATWYSIKINGLLSGFASNTSGFNDGGRGFAHLVPSDLRDPATGTQLCAGMDASPTLCAPFQEMLALALVTPNNPVRRDGQSLIYWINDGGIMNKGWFKTTGIDWSANYDWDMGELGTSNVGITGTYYLAQEGVIVPGASGPTGAVVDSYHTTVNAGRGLVIDGVALRPRLK
jgi:hypothetical protein